MRRRPWNALRGLSLVVLCAVVFGSAAWAAEREAPKEKTGKVVKKQEQREEAKREVVRHRPGKTVGKWSTTKSFTAPSPFGPNDCSGVCDEEICVCVEDWWDPGCCDLGCDLCWWVIDNT